MQLFISIVPFPSAVAIAFLCILVLDGNNFRGQTIPSPDACG